MDRDRIENEYFEWLYSQMCKDPIDDPQFSWRKLFRLLHDTEFRYSVPFDENRAVNGRYLRWSFILYKNREDGYPKEWWKDILPDMSCTVLEMIIRVARDCEGLMGNTDYGERTSQWFWEMIRNLGLKGMYDLNFNEDKAREIIDIFLDREYLPDGEGGLFIIRDPRNRYGEDMRELEIWTQMQWYFMKRS